MSRRKSVLADCLIRALSVSPCSRCAVRAARVQNQALRPNVMAASANRKGRVDTCSFQRGASMPANMSGICGGSQTARKARNGTATPMGSSAQRRRRWSVRLRFREKDMDWRCAAGCESVARYCPPVDAPRKQKGRCPAAPPLERRRFASASQTSGRHPQ